MYRKFGKIDDAWKAFDEIPVKDSFLYDSLILGFGVSGFHEEVLVALERMQHSGFSPNYASVARALMACGELRSLDKGLLIHVYIVQKGFYSVLPVANSLISMYINLGRVELARQVFDNMFFRDLVSWNSMIMGYARGVNWTETFDVFVSMQVKGIVPNHVTFLGLLMACGQASDFDLGQSIHGHLIRLGILGDLCVGTSIVDMYCKCGRVDYARAIFEEELPDRSLVSWNSLIAGYSRNGYDYEAVLLFHQMLINSCLKPDLVTMANLIPSYASLMDLRMIQSIHGFIIKSGIDLCMDVVLGTAMVDAYGKCSDIEASNLIFSSMKKTNTATWNALISGYNLNGLACKCMNLFLKMLYKNVVPDSVTLVTLLQSCGELKSIKMGMLLHGYCKKSGFDMYLMVSNAVIDMYMLCRCTKSSEVLFNSMPYKNLVTWNTMLCGFIRNGLPLVALDVFHDMQLENLHKPDAVTVLSVIHAFSALSVQGDLMHGFVLKLGLNLDILVVNSLVDAYSKCGSIDKAQLLFEQLDAIRDQSSWNAIISGCGMNGLGDEACSLFTEMEKEGHRPNLITFISLLSSCSHSGMVSEGCAYFELMIKKYGIKPGLEHYTCMIDMFGRAGRLEEAFWLIERMPKDMVCSGVWAAFLNACKMNMNLELGEHVGKKLMTLEPDNCGYYTTVANVFASGGKWDEASRVREIFDIGSMMKKAGQSVVMT
ncbi:pentatricopeptide repeat-containing protein At4g21300-like [Aristolochia californica]|uniref:pentatricopeptide repeat-containing protein At4g21300-like n=1 Tax=Aristolochia californica TaxID=171875 RepID=UPI0035E0FC17